MKNFSVQSSNHQPSQDVTRVMPLNYQVMLKIRSTKTSDTGGTSPLVSSILFFLVFKAKKILKRKKTEISSILLQYLHGKQSKNYNTADLREIQFMYRLANRGTATQQYRMSKRFFLKKQAKQITTTSRNFNPQ